MKLKLYFALTLVVVAVFLQFVVANARRANNKLSSAGGSQGIGTFVEDIGGGFRLDSQGRKGDGKVHVAVQKNGVYSGRTTQAQVAVTGEPHPHTIRKGLQRSLKTGRVVNRSCEAKAGQPEANARKAKAEEVRKRREETRAARIKNNEARNKGPVDREKPGHNQARTTTKTGQPRTRVTRKDRAAANRLKNPQGQQKKKGKQGGGKPAAGGGKPPPGGGKGGGKAAAAAGGGKKKGRR
ncbi:hypothetical protein BC829DRAFT_418454 [Chytridium lagenaria]|nr:hypothetical protein BC829DRAFT_418454 [Chytridium lagenaria]